MASHVTHTTLDICTQESEQSAVRRVFHLHPLMGGAASRAAACTSADSARSSPMPPGQAASDSITGQLERGWQGSPDCMQTHYARASDVVPAARMRYPAETRYPGCQAIHLLFTASCICIESCAVLTRCQHLSPAALALRWAHPRLCSS